MQLQMQRQFRLKVLSSFAASSASISLAQRICTQFHVHAYKKWRRRVGVSITWYHSRAAIQDIFWNNPSAFDTYFNYTSLSFSLPSSSTYHIS
eukprot:scaffold6206_cov76-Skeletonema_dohrnii-CCMP3373.AAC.2